MHIYANGLLSRQSFIAVLLLCLASLSVSNDVESSKLFLRSQDVIFDDRYAAVGPVTGVARFAELSLADRMYASTHSWDFVLHDFFQEQLVVPALFLLAMIPKHWASFQAEQEEAKFLAAVEWVPAESQAIAAVESAKAKLGLAVTNKDSKSILYRLLAPVAVFLVCLVWNHIVMQGTLFYKIPNLDDVGHFKKLLDYSAPIETLVYAFVANRIASGFYDPIDPKRSTVATFARLVFLCAVRRFMRDWAPRLGDDVLYLQICAFAAAFKYVFVDLSARSATKSDILALLVLFAFTCYSVHVHIRDNLKSNLAAVLKGGLSRPLDKWQEASKLVKSVWMFFLEDVHFYAGFSLSTWNSAFEKYQKESLAIPTIMTSADTTFLFFIYGTERMKYYYQYEQHFHPAGQEVVLCKDNATLALPRKCMNADFYQQSYGAMKQPESVPRRLFSQTLGLTAENLTWTNHIDVWVADYWYHAIRTEPRLYALFSSRLIVPVVTVLLAAVLYYQKIQNAVHAPPTMQALINMPLGDETEVKQAFKRYLLGKKAQLQMLHEDASYVNRKTAAKVQPSNGSQGKANGKSKKHGKGKGTSASQVLPSKFGPFEKLEAELALEDAKLSFWTVFKKFAMPFVISIVYFVFQQVLLQAHMFYQYDKTPEAAVKFVMDAIFPADYILTYTLATPLADSYWCYRPKSKSSHVFPISLLYGLGFYFIRRYGRFLRNRDYLHHFFGHRAESLRGSLLFSTNFLSGATLAVTTALIYALGGPLRVVALVSPRLAQGLHRLLSLEYVPIVVIALFTALVMYKADVNLEHLKHPENRVIALKRCVTVMWNFLKLDFQYATTYTMAAWPSYVMLYDTETSKQLSQTAAEAMKLMIIYAGETASAKPVVLSEFVSQ